MSNIKFFHPSFIVIDEIAGRSVSSAQTAFPATNLDSQRRSKTLRTSGYWNIASGSNTIVFQETGGVDLTATITAAAYTSTTSFLAALKTAFEDTGASTYTVTQDSTTGKINIASDGLGGAGLFSLMWTNGSSAAMAAILGYSTAADDTGALTYLADVLKIHTEEFIRWDLGLPSNPTAFALLPPKDTALRLSPQAVIKLQGSGTDNWTAPEYSQTLSYDDRGLVAYSASGFHTEGLRYWRLSVVDPSNPWGYVELGAVFLGDVVQTTRGRAQFPLRESVDDRSSRVTSEYGNTFSDKRTKLSIFSLDYSALSVADKELLKEFTEDVGLADAFFVYLDEDEVFNTEAIDSLKYVKLSKEPSFELSSPGFFTAQIELKEEP